MLPGRGISRGSLPVTGIVLAGGKSLRLGREKALEKIEEQSLIKRTIDRLPPVCRPIIIVTSAGQYGFISLALPGYKVVVDAHPGRGPLGGIYTGLISSGTPHSLVVACDMPLLNRELLRYLVGLAPGYDAVIPMLNGLTEPLHAVYSKDCIGVIEELLNSGRLGVSGLFNLVKTRYVRDEEVNRFDSGHQSFFNVNTVEDLAKAAALLRPKEKVAVGQKVSST